MMHCDTTGAITIFLGMVTLVLALALFVVGRTSARQGMLLAAVVAALAQFPLYLFWPGVCKAATMPCRIGTLPAVLLVSGIQLLVAVAGAAETRGGRV